MSPPEAIQTLNDLCRMELSTVEAYREAYEKLNPSPLAMELFCIEEAHEDAVVQLTREIERLGAEPQPTELGWGFWERLRVDLAHLFRERMLIQTLRTREESELEAYQVALNERQLPEGAMSTLRYLIRQERHHLDLLDHAIKLAA